VLLGTYRLALGQVADSVISRGFRIHDFYNIIIEGLTSKPVKSLLLIVKK